jgi:nuclear transport factor 2 (NTF2) superfamily protein
MTNVTRVKGHWGVLIDGATYFMNRFGVVWQEEACRHFPGYQNMLFVNHELTLAVQRAVSAAGYPSRFDGRDFVWAAMPKPKPMEEKPC